ncbi:PspC domain-containing protein [Streptoalloteichus tenebrarius]|nr:PspC domain-containing protein [Streptoalloteichus tenebrarius]
MRDTPGRWAAVEDTAGDLWATRPRRPRTGRKVAGVAAGIGRRYGVDPVLVRVGFATLTFAGGVGVLLYVLGWLLLPEDGDEVSAVEGLLHRGRASTSGALTAALALALIPISAFVFDGDVSAFVSLGLAASAVYLLHRHRGQENREFGADAPVIQPAQTGVPPTAAPPVGVPPMSAPSDAEPSEAAGGEAATRPLSTHPLQASAATTVGPAGPAAPATPTAPTAPTVPSAPAAPAAPPVPPHMAAAMPDSTHTAPAPSVGVPPDQAADVPPPPAWDPLGVAPFAWDLPEPAPTQEERQEERGEPKRRSRVTAVTFALALVTGGVGIVFGPDIGWTHVPGLVLAVLGVGMLAGSFLRGGRGLIALAVPVGFLAMAGGATGPVHEWEGAGAQHVTPNAVADVQPSYTLSAGDIDLDLSQLRLTKDDQVTTRVRVQLGNVSVRVPRDADVEVECTTGLGDAQCLSQRTSGSNRTLRSVEHGPDGPGGGKIVLEARTGMGNVEVLRD